MYNIPAEADNLPEGVPPGSLLENGAAHGANSWGTFDYGGPCPPPGAVHQYVFTIYALDTVIDLEPGAGRAQLLAAMEGHILSQAVLVGDFGR